MTESLVNKCSYGKLFFLLKRIDCILPILAIIYAWTFFWHAGYAIDVTVPAVLVLISFFLLVSIDIAPLVTLQKIAALCLFFIPVNEISQRYISISVSQLNINFSHSLPIASLCMIAYLVGKLVYRETHPTVTKISSLSSAWLLTVAVLASHILFLTALLKIYYGYGHERNLAVFGHICLYFLLFIFLWEKLELFVFRWSIGLITIVFSGLIFLTKG